MLKVMVVDDEDILVEMVAAFIEDMGFQTTIAADGEAALSSLVAAPDTPALILSDVMMPRMSGVDLARAVRCDPRFRKVPIILMSAAGRPAGSTMIDGFIHKPFDLDVLATLIYQYISGQQPTTAVA